MDVGQEITFSEIVDHFSNGTLPKELWDHKAHLMVAFWHNWHFDFDRALNDVRIKIKQYNKRVGTPDTDESGYHESLTIFWMIVVKSYLSEQKFEQLEAAFDKFWKSNQSDKNLFLTYYSPERIYSVKARKKWLNGDLKNVMVGPHLYKNSTHFGMNDDDFTQAFVSHTLSPELFTHEAHLRLAYIFIKRYGIIKALDKVSTSLSDYVGFHGASDKYNHSLTIAAVSIIHHFLNKADGLTFWDFILEFPQLKYEFKSLIDRHYSFDIFHNEKAKKEYLEPDLLPFT